MAGISAAMTTEGTLPKDGTRGALAGRVWLPDADGPAIVAVRVDGLYDISRAAATMRDLCEADLSRDAIRASHGSWRRSTCRPSRPPA